MGLITFNGQSSADFGFEVTRPPQHNFPKRIYEKVIVPGKDGEIIYDTGSYSNVSREYDINFIVPENGAYEESARKVVDFLHSPGGGYFRLEDTYEPDYYRMACVEDDGSISNMLQRGGATSIKFNCKPQCWLKSGETPVNIPFVSMSRDWFDNERHYNVYKYGTSIRNDTFYSSPPLFIIDFSDQNVQENINKVYYVLIDRGDTVNNVYGFGIELRRFAMLIPRESDFVLSENKKFNIDYYLRNVWSSLPEYKSLNKFVNKGEHDEVGNSLFFTNEFFGLDPKISTDVTITIYIDERDYISGASEEFDPTKIKVSVIPRWWVL